MSINTELREEEEVIKKVHPTRWAFLKFYVLAIFGFLLSAFIIPLIAGIVLVVVAELKRKGTTYLVTTERIIKEYTFISRNISGIRYNKIQDIHLTQGFLDRVLDIGSVQINTAGSTIIELTLTKVSNPIEIKKEITMRLN